MPFLNLSLSGIGALLLQLFVIGTFIYLFIKHEKTPFTFAMLFIWYPRVFEYYGKTAQDISKIIMLALVIYIFVYYRAWRTYQQKDSWFLLSFILYVMLFLIATTFFSTNSLTIKFSQLSRYVESFLLYFIMKELVYNRNKKEEVLNLCYDIILMNILISIVKWIIFRHQIEGLVGTICIQGGSHGTSLPIIGFIVLWIYRNGNFTWKDWLFVLGLLIIGFTTGKRAVMFILPVVIMLFMTYAKGIQINKYLGLGILAVPILFYFGVRLTPSLNPDNKVWGTFDWEFAFDYAEHYQFGEEGMEGQAEILQQEQQINYAAGAYSIGSEKIEAEGRGGATIALLKLIFGPQKLTEQDLWGIGFKNMYGVDYGEFNKLPLTIHINHKGSATGIFQTYVTWGVFGIAATLLFCFIPFFYIKPYRFRILLLGIVIWEYFMYTGDIFRTPSFMAVIMFIISYLNYEYDEIRIK